MLMEASPCTSAPLGQMCVLPWNERLRRCRRYSRLRLSFAARLSAAVRGNFFQQSPISRARIRRSYSIFAPGRDRSVFRPRSREYRSHFGDQAFASCFPIGGVLVKARAHNHRWLSLRSVQLSTSRNANIGGYGSADGCPTVRAPNSGGTSLTLKRRTEK